MMSSTLSKIHVTNSTGLSLNERFTAISTQPKVVPNIGIDRRSRSRSRSVQRQMPVIASSERITSRANQRLIDRFQRKHMVQAALKLKRRSMRTVGGGSYGNGSSGRIRRGSVKAFRVGANGKPIRTNSLTRVATMKADKESLKNRGRSLRRSNSSGNLANRLGPRRPTVGGAAQRVAKRYQDRQRGRNGVGNIANIRGGRSAPINNNRGRSRSRSRTRTQHSGNLRNRSRTRNLGDNQLNNSSRNRSRNRYRNDFGNVPSADNNRRGRSRSRSRGRANVANKANVPIKARLGVHPATMANRGPNNRRRSSSQPRRGVQTGRVQKRRNSTNINAAASDTNVRRRIRSRSANRSTRNDNVRSRSRSRTRRGQVGQQRQQGQRNGRAPRGRSVHRRSNDNNASRRGSNNNGRAQTQQRRGRSRTGRGSNGAGSRSQGNKTNATPKSAVNKDDLDKELEQYMATTKTENEMDYLLKN